MMANYQLSDLKPLSGAARDDARNRALRRVQKLAGPRPTRQRFTVEYARLFGVLDWLAAFVFVSALVISSLNILSHMGRLASAAYVASPAGIAIPRSAAVVLTQLFSIPLAEFSMVAFLVMFGLARGWRRYIYLALAMLATGFLLVANIQSGIGTFEAALPALFTIGTGLRLEFLLTEQLKRREDVDRRYRAALADWTQATSAPEQHAAFRQMYAEELWGKLTGYKANEAFIDAPPDFKRAAIQRELDAMRWTHTTRPINGAESASNPNEPNAANNAETSLSQYENRADIAVQHANNGRTENV